MSYQEKKYVDMLVRALAAVLATWRTNKTGGAVVSTAKPIEEYIRGKNELTYGDTK